MLRRQFVPPQMSVVAGFSLRVRATEPEAQPKGCDYKRATCGLPLPAEEKVLLRQFVPPPPPVVAGFSLRVRATEPEAQPKGCDYERAACGHILPLIRGREKARALSRSRRGEEADALGG